MLEVNIKTALERCVDGYKIGRYPLTEEDIRAWASGPVWTAAKDYLINEMLTVLQSLSVTDPNDVKTVSALQSRIAAASEHVELPETLIALLREKNTGAR